MRTRVRGRATVRIGLAVLLALAGLGVPGAGNAAPGVKYTFVEMSDGTDIAVSIAFPEGFGVGSKKWPALFQMDGYGGGGSVIRPDTYGDKYVTVYASVRGTGCSGGRFDLFDRRHAMDGYEIIENFIAKQGWSNGKVGIVGYSYPGLTGWMVASTSPPSVKAISLGGLIDDLHRGIVHPGGVPNYGFPAVWTGVYRPAAEVRGNTGRYLAFDGTRCYENIASRPPRNPVEDPIIRGATELEDGPWWQFRSTITWINGIRAPIHITQHHQDEQTGPRGGWVLWEKLPDSLPKRLVATNGRHGISPAENVDRKAWLDCWLIHDGDEQACNALKDGLLDPERRVQIIFESQGGVTQPAAYESADFPMPETDWRRYYLHDDGTASTAAPTPDEGARAFVSGGRGRQAGPVNEVTSSSGPDELGYVVDFAKETAIAGPITATLNVTPTSVDTDLMVTLIDVAPDGKYQYLQRGLLRASLREIDALRSDYIEHGPMAGTLYRPYRPHAGRDLLTPGQPVELVMEVFPVAHVFRAGHRLLIKVSAPSHTDPISDIYAYPQDMPPSGVVVNHAASSASSLLLPVVQIGEHQKAAVAPECGSQSGVRCTTPLVP